MKQKSNSLPPGQSIVDTKNPLAVEPVKQTPDSTIPPAQPENIPEIKINILDMAKHYLCSFEMAKQASAAGMTCANTYFSYDENGNIGDGGWLEGLGYQNFYPCINFPFAVAMLEDTDLDASKVQVVKNGSKFIFSYDTETAESSNIVDVIIMMWIRHRKT